MQSATIDMTTMLRRGFLSLALLLFVATPSVAFVVPSRFSTARASPKQQPSIAFFAQDEFSPLLHTVSSDDASKQQKKKSSLPQLSASQPIQTPLPTAILSRGDEEEQAAEERLEQNSDTTIHLASNIPQSDGNTILQSLAQSVRRGWKSLVASFRRPSNKFRLRLGFGAVLAVSVSSVVVSSPPTRVYVAVRQWIQHRGFTGLAALGRSVAYGWALLVGYPRLLDRRARESQRQVSDHQVEQQRQYLRQLAAEALRLRQELASLDKEIRTFRREIIALRANQRTKHNNAEHDATMIQGELQEAIGAEMTHLAQLRADTQAALVAVRKTWADVRAKSSPELWHDTMDPSMLTWRAGDSSSSSSSSSSSFW